MSEKKNEFNYITRKGYKYPAKHCSMYNYDYLKFDLATKTTAAYLNIEEIFRIIHTCLKIYLMKNEAINEMSAGVKRKMFQTTTNK